MEKHMKKPYNEMDKESILNYAKRLEGKTLRDLLSIEELNEMGKDEEGNKGKYGQKIEKHYFKYAINSDKSADFPCGLELKATPLKRLQNGTLSPKERLVCNIINYEDIIYEDWENSSFLEKNSEILLLRYIDPMDKSISQLDYQIVDVQIHNIFSNPSVSAQFEKDWNVITDKIKRGEAHNLSESDTVFLGACTKGSTAAKSLRTQPNSIVKAKQRAFSFKTKYMKTLI